ncbi:hypothetical protein SeLEV6574_g05135 [Synchytrium endobioticum]|uniref:Uncharacterized protein n=1 Tax=Synchytrium endobioticum TaxID=286115 RepID=A0A507CVS0_9FUNG|nr:hypothetical protein SeLEV6574_g05135 [Synchytrium endobioticum]
MYDPNAMCDNVRRGYRGSADAGKDSAAARRSGEDGAKRCRLWEMVQYQCELTADLQRVICRPFTRVFRRCANASTIEVTPVLTPA